MEMDSIQLDSNIESIEDKYSEQLLSPCSPDICDIFGDPQVLPRVGHQYQAEIPLLIAEYDRLQLIKKSNDTEVMLNSQYSFLLGLPIPIMWADDEVEIIKQEVLDVRGNRDAAVIINGTVEFENSEESQISSNNEDAKPYVEPLDTLLNDGEEAGGLSKLKPMVGGDKMDVDFALPQENKTKLDHRDRGNNPLPGSLGESWRDIEHGSFLLGLYIFGKNLLLVKSFVESKEMGDILSFYYGKFYRSDGHHRWSECRKLRSRRCIHGQRIFTGWRQQEILSRLFSHLSEECQNMLLQVSRTFGEGKISLEEYVSTLKDTVGINMLIEAVGIGKGKQDLTGIAMEPIKTNHVFSVRPEIPVGKACSSLTSGDIIKFLTGDFRLSKARSGDLFWEAVWPRLLARGWHSEQPKDQCFSGSKHSLVFLIPGFKKFSRRLVKGNHYFDSVSDVLNKVASDPGLLELEIEAANDSGHKEEYRWDPQMKQDPDGLSNRQRHCYLQPRISNCNRDLMMFTIVDTSLAHVEEQSKVRELKSLPVETTNVSTPSSLSGETEENTSESLHDEAEQTNTSNPAEDVTDRGACADSPECVTSILNNGVPNAPDPTIVAVENHEGQSIGVNKQSRKNMKFKFSRKVKPGHSNYLAPITKQRQLTACIHGESSCSIENINADTKLNGEVFNCRSNLTDACGSMVFQVGRSQKFSSASSLAKGSPDESSEVILNGNSLGTELSPEKPQPRTLIDLNLPHFPPDFGTEEPFVMDMVHNHDNSCANKSCFLSETSQQPEALKPSDGVTGTEQQSIMNGRRQSTRNRPLTTRALEALECSFFNTKRKRKGVEALSRNNSMSRSSRRVHARTGISATINNGLDNDLADSKIEVGRVDAVFNTSMVGDPRL